MNGRQFLAGCATALAAADHPQALILATENEAIRIRAHVKSTGATKVKIGNLAAEAIKAGPWSVTSRRPKDFKVAAGPNDYFSEGPYWWPDPKNPGGPYIRRDGEQNPNRFTANRNDLGAMCEATLALGLGACLLDRPRCLERAGKVLSVWFLDAPTRMNPHLEFGQAIRGVNTGRGTGIIDTVSLIHAVQGMVLLERAGLDAAIAAGLRQWFADYLKWLTTSAKGLAEKKATNNHATWWTAQVAAFAAFTGDPAIRAMAWEQFRTRLVPGQIQPDGSCPREEARTKSLGYSSMNLDAYAVICRLAEMDGVDLWRFRTAKGIGVEKSFHYLMPYLLHPETWRKPQIAEYNPGGYVFPALAGVGLKSQALLNAYRKLPRAGTPWVTWVDLVCAV